MQTMLLFVTFLFCSFWYGSRARAQMNSLRRRARYKINVNVIYISLAARAQHKLT